jgi:hypothetical protein
MNHRIEIRRMVTGVESCTVLVDDATLKTITDKTITRTELEDLCWNGGDNYDVDVHEGEEPHSVYHNFHTINFEKDRG